MYQNTNLSFCIYYYHYYCCLYDLNRGDHWRKKTKDFSTHCLATTQARLNLDLQFGKPRLNTTHSHIRSKNRSRTVPIYQYRLSSDSMALNLSARYSLGLCVWACTDPHRL